MPSAGFAAAAVPEGSLKGLRVAWRPRLGNAVVDSQVLASCERAALALGELGAGVEPMDDDLEPVEPIWFAYSSAMWNARFRDLLPQWRDRLSPTLIRQMELGQDITGEAVGRALLARTRLYRKVESWFERFDVVLIHAHDRPNRHRGLPWGLERDVAAAAHLLHPSGVLLILTDNPRGLRHELASDQGGGGMRTPSAPLDGHPEGRDLARLRWLRGGGSIREPERP